MEKPDLVQSLSAAYDQWWTEVQPSLFDEDAHKSAPKINPFRKDYLDQMTKAEKGHLFSSKMFMSLGSAEQPIGDAEFLRRLAEALSEKIHQRTRGAESRTLGDDLQW
jgi:hypothetical protein